MNDLEREYVAAVFATLEDYLPLLPVDVQRKIRIAGSVLATHGTATAEEIRQELGSNWVLARRSRRIVERYGAGARCVTTAQYEKAVKRAIEKREAKP